MEWFPRPSSPSDIEPVPKSERWVAEIILQLLSDPTAREWQDKVGVAGPHDGSAKHTTRLLAAGGWVIKTNVAQSCASRDAAFSAASHDRIQAHRLGVWHPS